MFIKKNRMNDRQNGGESIEPTGKSGDTVLRVNKLRCPQNHPCPSVSVCPVGALSQHGYQAPTVDESKCIKCGKCARFCPMRALALEKM